MSEPALLRIDLDSNVFRNQTFINWLTLNQAVLSTGLSVIVFLETVFWYLTRDLSVEDFQLDLQDLNAVVTPLDSSLAQLTAETAKTSLLPFRHHARDFVIGTSAVHRAAILLTYNLQHFTWMPSGTVTFPEQFLEDHWDSFPHPPQ
jgi:predicted nucleic acid-binding protein